MRVSLRLAVAAFGLLSFSAPAASAQSSFYTYLDSWPSVSLTNWGGGGTEACYDEGPDAPVSSSLACVNYSHIGGTVSGSASKHAGNRQMQALASITQVSETNLLDFEAYSGVGMWNMLHFNVEAFEGDQLVFHFSTIEASSLNGGANEFTYTNYGLFLNGVEYIISDPICGCSEFDDEPMAYAQAVTGGVDVVFTIGDFASFQTVSYFMSVFANASSNLEGPGTVYSSISATLSGIDLVGSGNVWRESATFDNNGDAYFGEAATPEPASLVLLGTGLAGVALAVRRRRKTR